MVRKDDFFIEENKVVNVREEDYLGLDMYIQFMEAISRMTYRSLYVIDYYKKNFLHVSKNPLFLCGMSIEEVKNLGYDFYLIHVTKADLPLLIEINRLGFNFAKSVPSKNYLDYTLGYDFHMKQPSGKSILIHHEITPLRLSRDEKIWLALCSVSISSNNTSGNLIISRQDCKTQWRYNFESKKWIQFDGIVLKDYEKDILLLSAQGYTMNEISNRIHKSVDTIKGYKRVIFEKLKVENITEALSFAVQYKLI